MRILFVAAEGDPFVKTGGLADVVGSLPQELRAQGLDVRVIMPKFSKIAERYRQQMQTVCELNVPVGWRNQYCGIEVLEHQGVPFYFVDNEYYFKREGGIYGHYDDAERYAYFNRAVLEALPHLDFRPDVIHSHDWHAGLCGLFLHSHYAGNEWYRGIKTMFTIHNLAYQGVFPHECLGNLLGLGEDYFSSDKIEYHGSVNYLKAGIVYSDLVSTVSRTYAKEIQTAHYGEGLDALLWARRESLVGIVNGIDTESYNPASDPHLWVNFSDSAEAKRENKLRLQERLGLPQHRDIPLIAVISRLVSQKGFDLITHVLDDILDLDVQLVVLGTGDAHYEHPFRTAAERRGDRMRALIQFDEGLARQIYAASDLFLMPSLFEPCGLGQLIAMRYLSVPVVRETGGLRDTVQAYDEQTGEGNGFSFANINAHDMLYTIRRAVGFYQDRGAWAQLLHNVGKSDPSWKQSARQYVDQYRRLIESGEGTYVFE